MLNHLKRWNIWRKHNSNSPIHQFLVLLGLRHSPTLALILTNEEKTIIRKTIERAYEECNSIDV